ncbi:MAG TPA: hypothetical protein VGS07_12060 [Thermoanaerobaculia bacterium]|jgi:hypothetical protein|nr:hypothetical protein [Thermoanaerobaculia bacterium]
MVSTRKREIGKALHTMRLSRETVGQLSVTDPKEEEKCGASGSFTCRPACEQATKG